MNNLELREKINKILFGYYTSRLDWDRQGHSVREGRTELQARYIDQILALFPTQLTEEEVENIIIEASHKSEGKSLGVSLREAKAIASALIGKCGGRSESDLKGLIITKLRAMEGSTFSQIAEELTQAILATPTFSGEKDISFNPFSMPVETTEQKEYVKHIIEEGSHEHVLRYDTNGVHCSEPNCEVNFKSSKPIPAEKKECEQMVDPRHCGDDACPFCNNPEMYKPEPKPKERIEEDEFPSLVGADFSKHYIPSYISNNREAIRKIIHFINNRKE